MVKKNGKRTTVQLPQGFFIGKFIADDIQLYDWNRKNLFVPSKFTYNLFTMQFRVHEAKLSTFHSFISVYLIFISFLLLMSQFGRHSSTFISRDFNDDSVILTTQKTTDRRSALVQLLTVSDFMNRSAPSEFEDSSLVNGGAVKEILDAVSTVY